MHALELGLEDNPSAPYLFLSSNERQLSAMKDVIEAQGRMNRKINIIGRANPAAKAAATNSGDGRRRKISFGPNTRIKTGTYVKDGKKICLRFIEKYN